MATPEGAHYSKIVSTALQQTGAAVNDDDRKIIEGIDSDIHDMFRSLIVGTPLPIENMEDYADLYNLALIALFIHASKVRGT